MPELKTEYDAVLLDGRADYFKQLLGKAQLGGMRDEAKRELDAAAKDLKRLEMEVREARRRPSSFLLPRSSLSFLLPFHPSYPF